MSMITNSSSSSSCSSVGRPPQKAPAGGWTSQYPSGRPDVYEQAPDKFPEKVPEKAPYQTQYEARAWYEKAPAKAPADMPSESSSDYNEGHQQQDQQEQQSYQRPIDLPPVTKEEFLALLEPANVKGAERVRREFAYAQELVDLAERISNSPAFPQDDIFIGYGLRCRDELLLDGRSFLAEINNEPNDAASSSSDNDSSAGMMGWSARMINRLSRTCLSRLKAAGIEEDAVTTVRAYLMLVGSENMPRDTEKALGQIYARLGKVLKAD